MPNHLRIMFQSFKQSITPEKLAMLKLILTQRKTQSLSLWHKKYSMEQTFYGSIQSYIKFFALILGSAVTMNAYEHYEEGQTPLNDIVMEDGWKSALFLMVYVYLNSKNKNFITSISYNLKNNKFDFRLGNSQKLAIKPNLIKCNMEDNIIKSISYSNRNLIFENQGKWDSRELFLYINKNGGLFEQ